MIRSMERDDLNSADIMIFKNTLSGDQPFFTFL